MLKIVNGSSNVVGSYTCDAWGKVLSATGTIAQANPIRYRSYYYDAETGLYYLQSRYYDPEIGRFISADDTQYLGASGTALGYNLFGYCENNPVNAADPDGYLSGSAVAKWVNTSSVYLMFIDGLYYAFASTLVRIAAYVTRILLPKVIAFVWWHPWIAAGIVVAAVAITIAAVLAFRAATIRSVQRKIPNKLKTKDGSRVDLSKFQTRLPGGGGWKGPDGWKIMKDFAQHAGTAWKLFDRAGNRVASLWADGRIRGK